MSATGRGAVRNEADYYPTPAWCVHRLLERVDLPDGYWLEPAIGGGAIVEAVQDVRSVRKWSGFDIREDAISYGWTRIGNFLQWPADERFTVAITNPPYALALEFVQKCLPIADWVVMLLRLNFIGSAKRSAFFRSEMPDVYVLPNRPSFTGGGTDAIEYAWCVWTPERGRKAGRVEVLAETPASERRAA